MLWEKELGMEKNQEDQYIVKMDGTYQMMIKVTGYITNN